MHFHGTTVSWLWNSRCMGRGFSISEDTKRVLRYSYLKVGLRYGFYLRRHLRLLSSFLFLSVLSESQPNARSRSKLKLEWAAKSMCTCSYF